MKLKMAIKFILDLNSDSDEYIEFKLLLEEDILKLDLDDYVEDTDSPNTITDEALFDYSCMKIFNRFHKVEYKGEKALYYRVTAVEIDCEEDNIKCLLNILYDYEFDNFLDIEKRLRDKFNFRESFKSKKKSRNRNKRFGKNNGKKEQKSE